jgi:hypothetical protein
MRVLPALLVRPRRAVQAVWLGLLPVLFGITLLAALYADRRDGPLNVLSLEFVGNEEALRQLCAASFDAATNPLETCASAIHSSVSADLWLTLSYLLLLGMASLAGRWVFTRPAAQRATGWGAAAAVAAFLADSVENAMLRIGATSLTGEGAVSWWPTALRTAALAKWTALVIASCVALLVVSGALTALARYTRPTARFQSRELPAVAEDLDEGSVGRSSPYSPRGSRTEDPGGSDGPTGVGLALSGGGIRSAVFSLGAIAYLQRRWGDLSGVRLVTAVSGGAYLAGSWQALRHQDVVDPLARGSATENRLRRHGNYVADTASEWLTALVVVLRGVVLNLLTLAALIAVPAAGLGWFWARSGLVDTACTQQECRLVWQPGELLVPTALVAGVATAVSLVLMVLNGYTAPTESYVAPAGAGAGRENYLLYTLRRMLGPLAVGAWWLTVACIASGLLLPGLGWATNELTGAALRATDFRVPALTALVTYGAVLFTILSRLGSRVDVEQAKGWAAAAGRLVGDAAHWLLSTGIIILLVVVGAGLGGIVMNRWATLYSAGAVEVFADATAGPAEALHEAKVSSAVTIGLLAAWLLCATYLIDQTRWSLHPFYKKRLASAFLMSPRGEPLSYRERTTLSRWGKPQSWPSPDGERPPQPRVTFAAAANLSGATLTPPGRRATSFTFDERSVGGPQLGYLPTERYERWMYESYRGDATLLGAMAISGAAFASAMGRMNKGMERLLAVGNARLGVWLPNPAHVAATRDGPQSLRWLRTTPRVRGLPYLLREIVGAYDVNDRMVYLTDGGHYENSGIVEMLRRRPAQMLCLDASGASQRNLASLRDSLVLAWEELGVQARFEGSPLVVATGSATQSEDGPGEPPDVAAVWVELEGRLARTPVAAISIEYPAGWDGSDRPGGHGTLVYARAVMTAESPPDVLSYATGNARFPDDPTSDQWFGHDQFAAYQRIGEWVAEQAWPLVADWPEGGPGSSGGITAAQPLNPPLHRPDQD